MPISLLKINHFRNLSAVDLSPGPRFNLFYGDNGSGKTSLLEAIYYLGLGKSFRTSTTGRIIQYDAECLSVFIQFNTEQKSIPVGIERYQDGSKKLRFDGENLASIAALAKRLPLQLISTDSYRYFSDGPKPRRQFLDWGVFHVEPDFLAVWQQFQQALKQRNACLKQRAAAAEVTAWNQAFIESAERIDGFRSQYIHQLQPILNEIMQKFLPAFNLKLRYMRGWNKEENLADLLSQQLQRDYQFGYSQSGPQRADCQLYCDNIPAQDALSQGQQKLAAYALHLAQGIHYHQTAQLSPIYLIDDMPSELDPEKRQLVTDLLTNLNAQTFITGITQEDLTALLNIDDMCLFHVEQGCVFKEDEAKV